MPILPFLGNLVLSKLTPDALYEMVTQLLKADLSTQTVMHVIYAISPIIQYAIRNCLLGSDGTNFITDIGSDDVIFRLTVFLFQATIVGGVLHG